MTVTTGLSAFLITMALFFYSAGVWSERYSRYLKSWHLWSFWTGFLFDITGTMAMGKLRTGPFNIFDLHTLTGQIALWLMLAHATWATYVVIKGNDKLRKKFHRYSLIVWLIWLIPYFGGMLMGMTSR